MTTIYMHPTAKDEIAKLSDGSRALVDVEKTSEGQRYGFKFTGHCHPNFWCSQPLQDGLTVRVDSIDGPEQFKIALR
ncbi:hypothetical protein [Secundilactobacillus folii]|uniref:Uncharacterized protein n=1 Tax=Secundilactobacillus folii TaxID=2678357 RepID=A0A7X2XUY2_9LACO|nr:hypothetical protein [Secundilactobacillus folii]MTV81535.1 hypothetical protein [Secundilactobacillus folii]